MNSQTKNTTRKILVTEAQEIAPEAILMLQANGYEVIDSLKNADAKKIDGLFIRTYTKVTPDYLDQFPGLQFILRAGVGTDNIDLQECKAREIQVFNSPGSNASAVAEYVLAMMLMLLKRIPQQIEQIKNNQWRDVDSMGTDLQGKVIGLVGCGAIGKSLANKLQPFGVSLLGYDPYLDSETLQKYAIKKCNLQDLLKNADLISLQLPLSLETTEMFGKKEFIQMKKGSILINVSRGELIKEDELLWALKNRIIAGAALDVVSNEPSINKELLNVPNLIVTPHIAGFTKEANIQMATGAVTNLFETLKGNL